MMGVPEDAVKILLVHEPDYADEAPLGLRACSFPATPMPARSVFPACRRALPEFGQQYPEGLQQAQTILSIRHAGSA